MNIVRLGIRAQLLLAIGVLLVLALVPLFFAVASLARASLLQIADNNARALGRAVAGHVSEAQRWRHPAKLDGLLDAQIGYGVGAIALFGPDGSLLQRAGERAAVEALPLEVEPRREQSREVQTASGRALLVLVPGQRGAVAALIHTDPGAARVAPLVRLVALYTGLLGLALLIFSYLALTRIVVNPVERLSRAAGRVADGARVLSAPLTGGRELVDLGVSLTQMTSHLRAEEEALRAKVDEVEAATKELMQAQDSLVRSERLASVGRLAAGLAHEIGNPIAAILGFQELLLEGGMEVDEQRDFLRRMKRETERVNGVLRQLLDFARPAAGGRADQEGEKSITSVRAAVDHISALVRPQKAFSNVALEVSLPEGVPPVAMGQERLEQVLLNLLLNAADAVPEDEGKIFLSVTALDECVRLLIEDNGGGIDPAVRDRLFEPFVTSKEVGKGTGLGLAVCRGLIESASGTIVAEDGDAGARFVLTLPVAR